MAAKKKSPALLLSMGCLTTLFLLHLTRTRPLRYFERSSCSTTDALCDNHVPAVSVFKSRSTVGGDDVKFDKLYVGCETWLSEYITWHAQELQRLKAGEHVEILVYTCGPDEFCGGIGDRISGILSTFYVAVVTKRLFMIDHPSPFPLRQTLIPALIVWDATFLIKERMSTTTINLVDTARPLESFAEIFSAHGTGVGVIRLKINRYYVGMTLWASRVSKKTNQTGSDAIGAMYKMRRDACVSANVKYFSELVTRQTFHLAFWALFEFSIAVKKRSMDMLQEAKLTSSHSQYVAVHARIGGTNPDSHGVAGWDDPARHDLKDLDMFISCAVQKMERGSWYPNLPSFESPKGRFSAMVFSDRLDFKVRAHKADERFGYSSSTTLFHVDRSKTSSDFLAEAGNVDAYAELLLLSEAVCIVGSVSTFSGLAASISSEAHSDARCFCIFDSCGNDNVDFFEQTERSRVPLSNL